MRLDEEVFVLAATCCTSPLGAVDAQTALEECKRLDLADPRIAEQEPKDRMKVYVALIAAYVITAFTRARLKIVPAEIGYLMTLLRKVPEIRERLEMLEKDAPKLSLLDQLLAMHPVAGLSDYQGVVDQHPPSHRMGIR